MPVLGIVGHVGCRMGGKEIFNSALCPVWCGDNGEAGEERYRITKMHMKGFVWEHCRAYGSPTKGIGPFTRTAELFNGRCARITTSHVFPPLPHGHDFLVPM